MSGVPEDRPPRLGLRMLMKAGLAMLVITLLCAASVATAVLLEVKKDADIFQREQIPIPNIEGAHETAKRIIRDGNRAVFNNAPVFIHSYDRAADNQQITSPIWNILLGHRFFILSEIGRRED